LKPSEIEIAGIDEARSPTGDVTAAFSDIGG